MQQRAAAVRELYAECLAIPEFAEAIESDTAGLPHTHDRLSIWGNRLRELTQLEFAVPAIAHRDDGNIIEFAGFR